MKLVHSTIFTKKMEESLQFYQKMLGLEIARDMRDDPNHQIVFLTDGSGDFLIELVKDSSQIYYGGGISIGFAVENLDHEFQRFQDEGYLPGNVISPNPHARFFFVKDPNDLSIQINQEN